MKPNYRLWFILTLVSALLPHISCNSDEKPEVLDACDLSTDESAFIFCQCDGGETGKEATNLNCLVNRPLRGRDDAPEWDAISRATNAAGLEFKTMDGINAFPPIRIFRGLQLLLYVKISNGDIETIPSYAFANSSSLVSVALGLNRIRHLAPNSFANMINLTNLQLEGNPLTEIQRNVFVNLPSLKTLQLERGFIHTIHDDAFKDLGALESLELQSNNITTITPGVFTGLRNLRRLDLMRNSITFLGHDVFKEMTLLDDLDLTGNQINAVSPHAFAGLKELRRLNLKGNKIVKFMPGTFSDSPTLYFLDLRNNALDSLAKDTFHRNIYENLKSPHMEFMVEGNRLVCNCSIVWLANLWNLTQSHVVKNHLYLTKCDVPQKSSLSYQEEDLSLRARGRTSGNVTFIRGPVEQESTTNSTGPTLEVIHLNSEDLRCQSDTTEGTTKKPPPVKGKKNRDRSTTRTENKIRDEEPLGRTQESLTGPSEPQEQGQQAVEPDSSASASQINCFFFILLLFPSFYSRLF